MIRTVFAFSFLTMAFSFVAEASERVVPRATFVETHLRHNFLTGALMDARVFLEDRGQPATPIHQLNHILQIHRENQAERREVFLLEVAIQIRMMAEQHAEANPEDLVAQHNLGYVLLQGIGGPDEVVRGQELIRRTEGGGLAEAFLLVDPWIFDEPTPPLLSIAYEIMRPGQNANWKNHPALVAWVTAMIGANIYIGCK